jgi:hypothetical protein
MFVNNIYSLGALNRDIHNEAMLLLKKNIEGVRQNYLPLVNDFKNAGIKPPDFKLFFKSELRQIFKEVIMCSIKYGKRNSYKISFLWGGDLSEVSLNLAVEQLEDHLIKKIL